MKLSYLLAFLALALFLSCHRKTFDRPANQRTLRISFNIDPPNADPRKSAEVCASTLNFLIYEGLTRLQADGEVELALAASIDVSPDGRVYLFHLREASWSDGAPITARDFEYSWKKILTPAFGSPCPHLFFPIKNAEKSAKGELSCDAVGIQALDDKTLRVELENPTPYFLSLISFCNFFPIPRHIEERNPSWQSESECVASGPFRLVRWVRNQEIRVEKNPHYWNAGQVSLPGVEIQIIPDEKTALRMYENRELDFVSTLTASLPMEDLAHLRREGKLQVTPMGGLLFCTFNLDRFPFNHPNIRKALSYAIDRQAIIDNLYHLADAPATRCIPPVLAGRRNRQLFPACDPEAARKLLAQGLQEAGLAADDRRFSEALVLCYEGSDLYRKIAQAVQQQWKTALGLDVRLQEYDPKTHLEQLLSRNYPIALDFLIVQYNDANNILERFKYKHMQKNLPGFENGRYIELLDQAARMNDPKKRLEALEEAEDLLMAEMPLAPIYHFNQGLLIDPAFANIEFSPLGNLLFLKIRPRENL